MCQIEITGYEKRSILLMFFWSKDRYGKYMKRREKKRKHQKGTKKCIKVKQIIKRKEKKTRTLFNYFLFFGFYISLPNPFRLNNMRFIDIICRSTTICRWTATWYLLHNKWRWCSRWSWSCDCWRWRNIDKIWWYRWIPMWPIEHWLSHLLIVIDKICICMSSMMYW